MSSVKVGPRHQITIPHDVFNKLKLKTGDFLELNLKEEKITLTPAKIIPRDEAWFYTREWQQKEKEADEDIAKGNVTGPFNNTNDLLKSLKAK